MYYFPDTTHIPAGFETFKCTCPGCRRKATYRAVNPLLKGRTPHGQDVSSYCEEHAQGKEIVTESPLMPNGHGRFPLYRRRQSCYGGWSGWDYAVICPNMAEIEEQ